MRVLATIEELRGALDAERANGRRVGFVPTMGYLHAGHASLIDVARSECDVVVLSIFVNPLQFGAGEDFSAYPRDLESDLEQCRAHGVSYVFNPNAEEMYRSGGQASIRVTAGEMGTVLCGRSRPGHFDGVCTVVAKLFNIVGPCRAYFGQKDAQQLMIIRSMVRELDVPVDIVGCPTVREPDGLALSSRNAYLTAEERGAAVVLSKALEEAAASISAGESDGRRVEALLAERVASEPLARLDYASCVDPLSLRRAEVIVGPVLLAVAAFVGRARLIDNVIVTLQGTTGYKAG
ncbi:MAG: pantoate--beta-alanine ligase [Actinomycetota bacterium]